MQIKASAGARDDNAVMPSTTLPASIPPDFPPSRHRITTTPAAPVFLPKEHGSWSLALEPLALGLLVAPSYGGTALATAALAGFFARRPLKAALVPDPIDHRRAARESLVMLSALAVTGLFEAIVLGGPAALWPLLLAVAPGGLFVYFDAQNNSRAAAAELAGSAAFALVPAALATFAGWSAPAALALTVIALARSIPTILAIRTYLRLNKQQPAGVFLPLLTGGLAGAGLVFLAHTSSCRGWRPDLPPCSLFARCCSCPHFAPSGRRNVSEKSKPSLAGSTPAPSRSPITCREKAHPCRSLMQVKVSAARVSYHYQSNRETPASPPNE